MSQPKVAKSKGKKGTPKLKVMHVIDRNTDGNTSYRAKVTSDAPKLREAVGPKPVKETVKPKENGKLSEDQERVLKALDKLGGTSESMPIAKEAGFTKSHPKAPRSQVRKAMKTLHTLHLVTFEKNGAKYTFSLTERGKQTLHNNPSINKRKAAMSGSELQQAIEGETREEAAGLGPASNPSTEGTECPWCNTRNPVGAEFCKECGRKQPEAVQAAPVAA